MPVEYNPNDEIFDPRDSGAALLAAVRDLADRCGITTDDLAGKPLAEVARLASQTYDQLPEFWRVWQQWHAPQEPPDMGDL